MAIEWRYGGIYRIFLREKLKVFYYYRKKISGEMRIFLGDFLYGKSVRIGFLYGKREIKGKGKLV